MKLFPHFLIGTYVLLPAICLLITPVLVSCIARAQQQKAKLLTSAVQTRARTAARIARARTPKLGQRSFTFSNEIRPMTFRRNRREATDVGTENMDMTLQKSNWDKQDESMAQLQNMWNMKEFNNMGTDDIIRSNMAEDGNEDSLGSPRISSARNAKIDHGGAFFRRNVYDDMLEQSNPMEHHPFERAPEPTFKLKKKQKFHGPQQGFYYPPPQPNYYYGYGRTAEQPLEEQIIGEPKSTDFRQTFGFNAIDDVIGQEAPREDHPFERAPEPTFKLKKKQKFHGPQQGFYYPPPQPNYYYQGYGRTAEQPLEEQIIGEAEPSFKSFTHFKHIGKNKGFGRNHEEPSGDPHEGHNHQTPEEVLRCELGEDIAKKLDLDYYNPNDYYERAVNHAAQMGHQLGDLVKSLEPAHLVKPKKEAEVEPHVTYLDHEPEDEKSENSQEKSANPTLFNHGHSFSHTHTFTHNHDHLKNLHLLNKPKLFGNHAESHAKALNFGIGGATTSFSKADSISSGAGYANANAAAGANHNSGYLQPVHGLSGANQGVGYVQPVASNAQAQAQAASGVQQGFTHPLHSGANAQAQAVSGGQQGFTNALHSGVNAQAQAASAVQQGFTHPLHSGANAQAQANSQSIPVFENLNEWSTNPQAHGQNTFAPSFSNAQANSQAFNTPQTFQAGRGISQAQANANANAQTGGFGQSSAQANAFTNSLITPTGFGVPDNALADASSQASGSFAQASASASAQAGQQFFQSPPFVQAPTPEEVVGEPREPFRMPHLHEIPVHDLLHDMEANSETLTRIERKQADPDNTKVQSRTKRDLNLPLLGGLPFDQGLFPRASNQDALGGLNLASNIVHASLNNNQGDGAKDATNAMNLASGIVETSLGSRHNKDDVAMEAPHSKQDALGGLNLASSIVHASLNNNQGDGAKGINLESRHNNDEAPHSLEDPKDAIFKGISSITGLVDSSIRTKNHANQESHIMSAVPNHQNGTHVGGNGTSSQVEPAKDGNQELGIVSLANPSSLAQELNKTTDEAESKQDDVKLGAAPCMTSDEVDKDKVGLQHFTEESSSNTEASEFSVTTPSPLPVLHSTQKDESVLGLTPDEIEDIQFSIPDNASTPISKVDQDPKTSTTEHKDVTPEIPSTVLGAAHLDPLAGLEAEMNSLTEEEKKTFIKQEMKLISEIVRESLQNDKEFMKEIAEAPEHANPEVTTDKSVASPNLIQAYPHARNHEGVRFRRSAKENEAFDAILGAHREKVQNIQHQAIDDGDLLLISFIGDGIIKDLENRRDHALGNEASSKTKRSLPNFDPNLDPFTRLVNDPNTKIDVEKTMDNIGTIVRHTFESPKAPMFHVRNMLGNTKNTVMSAVQVPPNNLLVPSEYEVVKASDPNNPVLGDINQKMLTARSGLEKPEQDDTFGIKDTFQKIGGFVKKSVDSGKHVFIHANDVAADARNAVHSIKESAPKLLNPVQIPAFASRAAFQTDLLGPKTIVLAPRLLDVQEAGLLGAQPQSNQFVGMGHIMDSMGVSKPEPANFQWDKIVLQPMEIHDSKNENLAPKLDARSNMGIIDLRSDKGFPVVGATLNANTNSVIENLEQAKTETGSESVHDLLDKVKQQVQEMMRNEQRKAQLDNLNESRDSEDNVGSPHLEATPEEIFGQTGTDLPPEVLKVFVDDLPIKTPSNEQEFTPEVTRRPTETTEETLGLALTPELLKPFMGRASEDNLNSLFEENGDDSLKTNKTKAAEQDKVAVGPAVHPPPAANIPESAFKYQIPIGLLLEEAEPKGLDEEIPEDPRASSLEETQTRTSMLMPQNQMKPFMGMLKRKQIHSVLNQYNNDLFSGEEAEVPQEHFKGVLYSAEHDGNYEIW